jgi:hypothetical protein
MDVLRTPLLDDEDRRKAFFESMPELFLSEFLNELRHHSCFSYTRINTLEKYDMLVSRRSFVFEKNIYRTVFDEFHGSFNKLRLFNESNFFTEGHVVVLQPVLKTQEPKLYEELNDELTGLCGEVVDRYKRLIGVFSKNVLPVESKTSVTRSGNTLRYDDKTYKMQSGFRQNLVRSLWDSRTTKKGKKNANGINPANVAVSIQLIESSGEFTTQTASELYKIVKDTNKYLRKIGFPLSVQKDKNKNMLIVVSD